MISKEAKAAYDKAYRQTHKEQIAARDRAYRQTHKEQIAAYNKAYRQAHKEQIAAYNKARCERVKCALQAVNPRPVCNYPCEDCFFFGVERNGKLYCAHDKTYSHPIKAPNLQCFMRFRDGQVMWLSMYNKPSASGKYRCFPLTH